MALSVFVIHSTANPTTKKKINDSKASRYEPVRDTTTLNNNGPIHEVPRSETS